MMYSELRRGYGTVKGSRRHARQAMSMNGGTHDFLDACLAVEEDSIEAGRRQGFQ